MADGRTLPGQLRPHVVPVADDPALDPVPGVGLFDRAGGLDGLQIDQIANDECVQSGVV